MKYLLILISLSIPLCTQSQVSSDSLTDGRSGYMKLYLDGASFYQDFIKTEIQFVNYVRDRYEADVHLLITSQSTGSGGLEYSMFYFGQNIFEGKNDTLQFVASTNNTEDETRKGLTDRIRLGLMRYVLWFPQAENISITFDLPDSSASGKVESDKWNNWVFTISANGYLNGQKSYSSYSLYGNASAEKVTEEWKLSLSTGVSINKSKYDFEDFSYESETHSKSGDILIVNSISNHWSVGVEMSAYNSSYSNYELRSLLSPALEFNVFPYSASTSHLFTFFYEVNPEYAIYTDTTLYNKKREFLVSHSLEASLILKEKWGSVNTSLSGSFYLHDFSKNQFSLYSSLNWRIVEGLSFRISGIFSVIHDQLNLSKSGISDEEVLTQQKELATSFDYFSSIGVSYTFGSIYNNVVNPRFDRGGGSFYF